MKIEIWVLFVVLIPGVLMDIKEKKVDKEYWLILSVATFILTVAELLLNGIQVQSICRCGLFLVFNWLIHRYGCKMEKMIGKSDLYCVNIFYLVLSFKYFIIVVFISLFLAILIGLILSIDKKIHKISSPKNKLHFEIPYVPMLYISYAIVNIESLLMRVR